MMSKLISSRSLSSASMVKAMSDALASEARRLDLADQRGHRLVVLRDLVARVQRGQFDRDRMAAAGDLAHRADRRLVGTEVALRIGIGTRRLAEHVEAGGEAAILALLHALHGFLVVTAHDENLAHHPHRRADRLADERLAGAPDQPLESACLLCVADKGAADDEAPGGRIDQGRMRFSRMRHQSASPSLSAIS
jgi:hypothetical protein